MGILLALIAGMFAPLTNLFAKKGVDLRGNAKAFFMIQMVSSFLFALCFGPLRKGDFSIHLPTVLLGIVAGLILSAMMFTLGRALEKGPPGFTFAILFSATVMPGLIMALIFGAAFGYSYHVWHGIGSILVILGLLWGAKGLQGMHHLKSWLLFVTVMFSFHLLVLVLYQWKGMLTNLSHPEEISPFTLEQITSEWFTPFVFLSSGIIQFFIYLGSKQGMPTSKELLYGILGGGSNFFCTFFILWSAEVAGPLENAVIFPISAVLGILLTNLWGQKLYDEKVNWRACQLSLLGLIVGTVDWQKIAAAIGSFF